MNGTATDVLTPGERSATSTGDAPVARRAPLPALTGVRTILAVNIVFFHFTPPHMTYLYPVINASYVFVGFFFLLSGFVLSYNYADRPDLDKRRFWMARFARLYPVYLLSLAISFKMLQAEWHVRSTQQFWEGFLMVPFLLQGWNQSLATFWNTVAWTLCAEVALYAAFPYLVRLIPWPKTPLRLVLLLLTFWAVGLIPHTLYLLLNPDHLTAPANRYTYGPWLRTIKYTPIPYLGTFLAGITLGKLQSAVTLTPRQRTWIAALSLVALFVFFAEFVTRTPYVLLHGGLLVPLFSVLILGLGGRNWVAAIFGWRPIVLLGQTTFCLYLLHFNTINLLRESQLAQHLGMAALDPWLYYLVALIVAALATFFVERPARDFILKRWPSF